MSTLNVIWFVLLFVLLAGYAVLDGFDLGVGILHLLGRDERERRVHLNAIGPVWDGNEVWLLTGGGALFAAFPAVYATVFSGFYLALMLLLTALIARAVAMEFRSKVDSPSWKRTWDWAFFLGSLLPALLLGVAFGNILRGLPTDPQGNFTIRFLGLLNPYAILIGALTVVLFTLHGNLYLTMKADASLLERARRRVPWLWMLLLVLYALATAMSARTSPFLFEHSLRSPLFWIFLAMSAVGLAYIPVANYHRDFSGAFFASSTMVVGMVGLAARSLFPLLVPSRTNVGQHSLTIMNSSSTPRTLLVMLVIALIGMPLVIAYTALIYRAFRGKVVLTADSY